MDKQEWLDKRRQGIGGSDIGVILGINPFKTPYELWLDKTGRQANSPENEYTRAGHMLEDDVANFWQEKTGINPLETKHFCHSEYPIAMATPDRIYWDEKKMGVLECKTAYTYSIFKNLIHGDVPEYWFCQLQWYMGVLGVSIGDLAWLYNGLDFGYAKFKFNQNFFEECLIRARNFWENYVLSDTPPEAVNSEDIQKMFNRHIDGKTVEATPETMAVMEEFKRIKAEAAQLEKRENALADQIKMVFQDAEGLLYDGKIIATWKTAKESEKFDAEAFKNVNPDLYKQFTKIVPGSRRLLTK